MALPPPDIERLIQDALAQLGWDADASAVAEKVRRLDIGLPREDEFAVLCAWLGRCTLLHKLDQQQIPVKSRNEFQVPDLLAFFETQSERRPVLIEVKSSESNALSFRPDYLERLDAYARLLDLPLLVAWKFRGLWTLFETKHMTKAARNYNVSRNTAMRENLLGVLVGDVAYKIGAGAGVSISFRKETLVDSVQDGGTRTDHWLMRVDDVSFTDYQGKVVRDLDPEVQSLFAAWDLEEAEDHSETHVKKRFFATEDGMEFAHRALVRLLDWESSAEGDPHWRALLRKDNVTTNIKSFSAALNSALEQKVVSHIFKVLPHAMPDFVANPLRGPASHR